MSLTPGEKEIARAIERLPPEMRARLEARAKAEREEVFRRYWRAWYSLNLGLAHRKPLHTEFGLPDSHKNFTRADVTKWESGCGGKRVAKLRGEIAALRAALTEEAKTAANRAVREELKLAPGTTLEMLDEEQLRAALRYLRQAKSRFPREPE